MKKQHYFYITVLLLCSIVNAVVLLCIMIPRCHLFYTFSIKKKVFRPPTNVNTLLPEGKIDCDYCGKEMSRSVYHKWHGVKCVKHPSSDKSQVELCKRELKAYDDGDWNTWYKLSQQREEFNK